MRFLLFYPPMPRSQVRILIYRNINRLISLMKSLNWHTRITLPHKLPAQTLHFLQSFSQNIHVLQRNPCSNQYSYVAGVSPIARALLEATRHLAMKGSLKVSVQNVSVQATLKLYDVRAWQCTVTQRMLIDHRRCTWNLLMYHLTKHLIIGPSKDQLIFPGKHWDSREQK